MIKIWSMKKNEEAAAKRKPKTSAAQIRVQKDLTELDLPSTMKTHFADPADLLNFTLTITPDEGMYKGGEFVFSFQINSNYPHDPPKVKCTQKIYHPNVDLEGNVCLNILREDWKPVLNLTSVMVGLQYLFLEPNPDDPLNKEAAEDLRRDRERFIANVKTSMRGGMVKSTSFDSISPAVITILSASTSSNRRKAGMNYYLILGVSEASTPAEIKCAYHKLLLQLHPDRAPGQPAADGAANSAFDAALLKEAYTTLISPDRRAQYDDQLRSTPQSSSSPASKGRPAQVLSLEDCDVAVDDQEWTYPCRCGSVYRITETQMNDDIHLVGCEGCSEVVWIGYEVVVDDGQPE
ncbi:NEDD8-conjugating protein ubc12 [Tulasnella sp. 403]|nr:NEDD8-conjugating protein ubc12 [Tulasnella sp. 403]